MIKIRPKRPLEELVHDFLHMAKDPKKGKVQKKLTEARRYAPHKQSTFWNFLEDNLDIILVGNPHEIHKIAKEINLQFPFTNTRPKKLWKSLSSIFNYEGFRDHINEGWNAYWLASVLGIDTCPYCNRLYTHTIFEDSKKISRPQFDHFMDKATHPYFGVSFFNLIPSCSICNTSLKGTQKFNPETHIHPYIEGFGESVKFILKILDCSFFSGNSRSGEIRFQKEQSMSLREQDLILRSERNIAAFKLEEMYKKHIDYAQEQVYRALIYNSDYLDSLFYQFNGSLFHKREDLIRFVAANYIEEENLQNRPLSKLTRDIAEQFDLWGNSWNELQNT